MGGKLKLGVLISGGGTNLQALIDACRKPDYPAQVALVISNEPDAGGLTRAEKAGIPHCVLDHKKYKSRQDFESAIHEKLSACKVELVCLAGFVRILTPSFTEKWAGKMINTHPSLLPKHGGKGMFGHRVHESVLKSGDHESGVSIHYVTAGVDEGPVIVQRHVPVLPDDNVETLRQRVLAEEHIAFVQAVKEIAEGKQKKS